MTLKGANALVTGAGRRIGRSLALALASEGANVCLHYFSAKEAAETVADEIRALGVSARTVFDDFENADAPCRLMEKAEQEIGLINILINNASHYPDQHSLASKHTYLEETIESWEKSLAINARSPFFLIQHFARRLIDQNATGAVLNLVDSSVTHPFIDRCCHSISKSTLTQITTLASRSFSPQIKVNTLELGMVLPGDEMPENEKQKVSWSGVEPVVEVALAVLKNPSLNGESLVVGNIR